MNSHFLVNVDEQRIEIKTTAPFLMLGQQGAIIGHLFCRRTLTRRIELLSPADVALILSSHGKSLIEDYWGGYVAVICCPDGTVSIMRDPSGIMPCYWSEQQGAVRCSNDIEDIACGERSASIDLHALARYLASPGYWGSETGLAGVHELVAGKPSLYAINKQFRLSCGRHGILSRRSKPSRCVTLPSS